MLKRYHQLHHHHVKARWAFKERVGAVELSPEFRISRIKQKFVLTISDDLGYFAISNKMFFCCSAPVCVCRCLCLDFE